ncbi:15006_t:CDS:2, partial [Cetraspora pellucida]
DMGACLCKPKLGQKRLKPHRRIPASSISSPLSDAHLIISDTFDCGVNEEYRFIDGRRFHNVRNSKYMMPCDDDELDRLHVLHYICRFIWKRNYSAPIHDKLSSGGALVLDIGCGTGTWVVEMANEFSRSHFTGIDISPVFPREAKPENALFVEANLLDGLPYNDNTFDYVHMRFLMTAFSKQEWEQIVRVTKTNGIIEIMEDELEPRNDGPISRLLHSA